MRDYFMMRDGRPDVPVNALPIPEIQEVLRDGILGYPGGPSAEAVRERLLLELRIRDLGYPAGWGRT